MIGFIIFLVVSTTGYFNGNTPNLTVLFLSIIYIAGALSYGFFEDKLKKLETPAFFVLAVCLIISIIFFVIDKEEVVGEMLIPVNHPIKQIDAAKTSIVGIVFYLISFITFAFSSFLDSKTERKEA